LLESKQLPNFFYIDRHQNACARCLLQWNQWANV